NLTAIRKGGGRPDTIRATTVTNEKEPIAMTNRPALGHRPGLRALRRSVAVAGLALACAVPALAADPKVLNIYNWSDYIADDTIKNFEKETGIKVNYDNYDTNEVLHAKLVAGQTGYDIVVPGAHFAKTQIEGGLLQKLDRSKLTN